MRTKWAWVLFLISSTSRVSVLKMKMAPDLLIGHVQIVLGIHRQTVRLGQLEQDLGILAGRLRARQTIHPLLFLGVGSVDLRKLLRRIKRLVPDAGNRRRVRPHDVGVIDDRNLLGLGVLFLLVPKRRAGGKQRQAQQKQPREQAGAIANYPCAGFRRLYSFSS